MTGRAAAAALALGALGLAATTCVRPADERAALDLDVGRAAGAGLGIEVEGGLAHVRALAPGELTLWAQAPVLRIAVDVDAAAAGGWTITVGNALPDADLRATAGGAAVAVTPLPGPRPTHRRWHVELPAGRVELEVEPPDADDRTPWRFAAMADIQTALPTVHEVFAQINATPDLRFVVSMGDITQRAEPWEYDLFEQQLETLAIPFYSTIGNHELFGDPARWRDRFGRLNVHFRFRDVAFTLIDTGSATIDPLVYGWLDEWLAANADRVHVFGSHYPPLDPIGVRQGAFASRREGARLLARLAAGRVDLTLYGHIHTYEAFENAGIPAYISGGGGADPMRFDGIDRHFLVVEVDPGGAGADAAAGRVLGVDVVRVDE